MQRALKKKYSATLVRNDYITSTGLKNCKPISAPIRLADTSPEATGPSPKLRRSRSQRRRLGKRRYQVKVKQGEARSHPRQARKDRGGGREDYRVWGAGGRRGCYQTESTKWHKTKAILKMPIHPGRQGVNSGKAGFGEPFHRQVHWATEFQIRSCNKWAVQLRVAREPLQGIIQPGIPRPPQQCLALGTQPGTISEWMSHVLKLWASSQTSGLLAVQH